MTPSDISFPDPDQIERDAMDSNFHYFDIDDDLVAEILSTANPPHRHDYEEIIWIRYGSAEHLLDGEKVTAYAQTLLIVPKGHVHRFMPSPPLQGCAIRFKDEFLPATSFVLFSQFAGLSQLSPSDADREVIDTLCALIRKESHGTACRRPGTVIHLLQALISVIEELKLRPLEGRVTALREKQLLWDRFNVTIETHFRTEHSALFYARELGVTPRKLNNVVRLFSGKGVAEAIDERLVLEAKRLILFSDMSIKEIAFDLGFREHSYFSKVFKKMTGLTPVSFRESASVARNYQP